MGRVGIHNFPLKTEMKSAGISVIRFTTNGTSDPDPALTVDPGGILDPDNPPKWQSQSFFSVALQNRYVRVFADLKMIGPYNERIQYAGYIEGTAGALPNGVGMRVLDAAGALSADTTGREIEVWLCLTSWKGRGNG